MNFSTEPTTRKYLKDMDFCNFLEIYQTNIENNYWIQDQVLQKLLPKSSLSVEATSEFMGKNADKIMKKTLQLIKTQEMLKK